MGRVLLRVYYVACALLYHEIKAVHLYFMRFPKVMFFRSLLVVLFHLEN